MNIQTKRLILRRFQENDLDDLYAYLSNAEVVKYEPYQPMSFAEVSVELKKRIANSEMVAVELQSNHQLIGNIYLGKRECNTLEIGYVFNNQYWHQGLAYEACVAVIDDAFAHGIHRIYAECDPENIASWRLLEKLNFKREAYLKQNVYFWCDAKGNPCWKDTYIYSRLTKKE